MSRLLPASTEPDHLVLVPLPPLACLRVWTEGRKQEFPYAVGFGSHLLPADSKAVPANRADYSIICFNLKIKTDKEKIFREQCQAEDIKLLSDLYLGNGFMPFNNLKRNIMFSNTLF